MDYPVQGSAQQRIRTRHLTLINENALPQSYALYKKEIINRFNLTYDLNFIFTNKDNKQEYITNENEYKHFIAINKTIPIITAECDSLFYTKFPSDLIQVTTQREVKDFISMGSMATLPVSENDEPQKEEDDEFQMEEEAIDLNETQPETKLVKMPPVRMGSGKPPRPHKSLHN